jgi:ferrous iron transport protein A
LSNLHSQIIHSSDTSDDSLTLDHIQVGEVGKIAAINAGIDLKQRFAALGLKDGSTVQVLRRASFGGPMHVRMGTTEIIMRLNEAKRILVVPQLDLIAAP